MTKPKTFQQLANLKAAEHAAEAYRLEGKVAGSASKALRAFAELDLRTGLAAAKDCFAAKTVAERERALAEIVREIRDNPRG